jgi:hypothetical protein
VGMLPDPNSTSRHGKPEKASDVNEHKHICAPCAWRARSNVTTLIKTCDGSKGQEISVGRPSGSGRNSMPSSARTRSHKPQASDVVLLSPPIIFSVVRSLKNGKLCETAEKELLSSALLEPRPGCFRTHVPTPREYEPDVGIKEIQCVHRSVRWSHPTFGLSETISGNFTLFGPRPLALQQDGSDARQNQLTDGATLGSGLLFQLPVEGNAGYQP